MGSGVDCNVLGADTLKPHAIVYKAIFN